MKNLLRLPLALLGVVVIISALAGGVGHGRSGVSFFLALALGGGLIIVPFTAFAMLLMYLLMLVCIVGFPILGAYIGVQITGKDSIGPYIGLIVGAVLGFKFAASDFFDKLLIDPLRKMGKLNDKE